MVRHTGRNYLTLCEVQVYGYGKRGGGGGNKGGLISRGKSTSQSSTGWGGSSSRAVDGKTDGRYGHKSCTHTHNQHRAWWKVNLRGNYHINRVIVWNRVDCCRGRLNNFEVLANGHRCGKIGHSHRRNVVRCGNRRANWVMVRHTGRNYLTLCEVQVYGYGKRGGGGGRVHLILRGKRTYQSSTGWGGNSARAVDGKTDGRYGHRSCTHTHNQHRAWWKVNLGRNYRINRVVVWNRVDCCRGRLNNFEVLANNRRCGKIGHAHRANTVRCHNWHAHWIMVRHTGRNYLTLCEVQVYGK